MKNSPLLKYQDAADSLLKSNEQFPVDFDAAWRWIGFARKDNAKKLLLSNFLELIDFEVFRQKAENPRGGRPVQQIRLNLDCFKAFCMMAGTSKGKEVRLYFIQRDNELRALEEMARKQALVVVAANVPHANVLTFLERIQPTGWREGDLIGVGFMVRRLARALGVPYQRELHPHFGSIRTYPLGLLCKTYDFVGNRVFHDSGRRLPWLPEDLEKEAGL